MFNVIRLGDDTSHGGKAVSVSAPHVTVEGIAIARVGDICSCPIKRHDNCTVAEGDAHHVVEGVRVAYEGCKTTCGAVLIASTANLSRP
jgi:uncharacterized Zn-binding protein involved in type VI secretion